MIERQAIAKDRIAQVENLRRMDEFPGWVLNSHALLYVGEEAAKEYPCWETSEMRVNAVQGFLGDMDGANVGVVVSEKRELRMPYIKGDYVDCTECDGTGSEDPAGCDCPHCTGDHDCEKCGGMGQTGTVMGDAGQVVFDGATLGSDLLLQGCYGSVVDGSAVRWDEQASRFFLYDQNGAGIAIIMLYRGKASEKTEKAA